MFCIKFGYYNTKDWKMCRYADPIVDTFGDILTAAGKTQFGGDEAEKAAAITPFMAIVRMYNCMMEKNLIQHGGKWAASNTISIADFIMASYIGNFIMNEQNPLSPMLKECLDETPKFKAYCMAIMIEFKHLKTRGNVGPF